jgi:hypothetical protein
MKAVIFDELYKVHNEVLEKISLEDYKLNVFGRNPREYFERFSNDRKIMFEQVWSEYYSRFEMDPEARNFLMRLKQSFKLFVVTSNTELNLHTYCKNNQL